MRQRISVIIAAFNEERHISECVESLLNQTLPVDEVIVVDDGSTDTTWQVLKQQKKQYARLAIYRKKHVEQATARNFGFNKSTGDILIFPDADYYFDRKFVEKLVAPILKNQAVATFTKEEYIANPENIWSRCYQIHSQLPLSLRTASTTPDKVNNFRAIKREIFLKAGGFSETGYTNDITVFNKLGSSKGGIVAPGAICYHYNPDTLTEVFISAKRMGSKGAFKLNLTNLVAYSLPNSLRKGIVKSLKTKIPEFTLFKAIFDFGVICGFIDRLFATYIKKDENASLLGKDM